MKGTANHQMTGGPLKAHRALIEVTVNLNVIETTTLAADFMVIGVDRGKRYGFFSTSPLTFNLFHDSKSCRF